jgi:serine-type anaerobic sulfatase-maturating enzyme
MSEKTFPADAPPAFHVLAKPTGAICNLDCKYCFFLAKESLYPGSRFRMGEDILETYIRQLLESHRAPEVTIAWQGGEPTLMKLPFFRRAIELVERHRRPGQKIQHTIQTNGTILDDEWAAFFREHGFLVGLSIDGPREIHDTFRVDKRGRGSFDNVMQAWDLLRKHQVDVNVLCTVHSANQERPLDVYRFFRDTLGAEFMQFIPIVERVSAEMLATANQGWGERPGGKRPLYVLQGNQVTDRSVRPEPYGRFLIAMFDEWVRNDVGKVFVQHFDSALANWVGVPGAVCIFAETCGNAVALEHNGDLYSCDHYVEPTYKLGNILDRPVIELISSPEQVRFGNDKRDTLPRYCRECTVRFACHGECPKNRFIATPDGEPGLNYLCAAYKAFFTHIDRPMKLMAGLLQQGRFADEVMALMADEASAD